MACKPPGYFLADETKTPSISSHTLPVQKTQSFRLIQYFFCCFIFVKVFGVLIFCLFFVGQKQDRFLFPLRVSEMQPLSGLNPRYEHTFVDEDAMGWAKKLAIKFTRRKIIERSLIRSTRVRLLSLKWRAKMLNGSANKRAV